MIARDEETIERFKKKKVLSCFGSCPSLKDASCTISPISGRKMRWKCAVCRVKLLLLLYKCVKSERCTCAPRRCRVRCGAVRCVLLLLLLLLSPITRSSASPTTLRMRNSLTAYIMLENDLQSSSLKYLQGSDGEHTKQIIFFQIKSQV